MDERTLTARHDRRVLARELIQRQLRTPIIHQHTQVPMDELRRWYGEVNGRSPRSGRLPTVSTLLFNRLSQLYVSIYAAMYLRLGGKAAYSAIDIHAVLEAWDLYASMTRHQPRRRPADPTEAWVIARELSAKTAWMRPCHKRRTTYLVASDSRLTPTCPLCFAHSTDGRKVSKTYRTKFGGEPNRF